MWVEEWRRDHVLADRRGNTPTGTNAARKCTAGETVAVELLQSLGPFGRGASPLYFLSGRILSFHARRVSLR
jgi:hypothetical protein